MLSPASRALAIANDTPIAVISERRGRGSLTARRGGTMASEPWSKQKRGRDTRPRRGAAALSTATASACARAFARPAAEALTDYEFLELVLFRALPRRDVKPLAKALIAQVRLVRRGDRRAAPSVWPRSKGIGEAAITELKVVEAAAQPPRARRGEKAAGAVVLVGRARLLPRRAGVRRPRAVSRPVSRQAQPAHRRRGPADRHRRPHAGLSARGGQARARTFRDRRHPRPQPSLRRSDAVAGGHPDDAADRRRRQAARHCRARSHHRRQARPRQFQGDEVGVRRRKAATRRRLRWGLHRGPLWLDVEPPQTGNRRLHRIKIWPPPSDPPQ